MSKIFEKIKKVGDNKFLIVKVIDKGSYFSIENTQVNELELENEINDMEKMLKSKKDLLKKLKNVT